MKMIMLCYLMLFNPVSQLYSKSTDYEDAKNAWKNGEIVQADAILKNLIENGQPGSSALHLYMKTCYVQGYYHKSLDVFKRVPGKYRKYKACGKLAFQAYLKLGNYNAALNLAREFNFKEAEYLSEFQVRPFAIQADKTYILPFFEDEDLPTKFWPGIMGTINGMEAHIRFDTGGDYIVMGVEAAKRYQLELRHQSKSMHASRITKSWGSRIDTLQFLSGPVYHNVPVTVMKGLGEYVIFGTNMLEPFLTTIDYPRNRFILTPRSDSNLKTQHYQMLSGKHEAVPFYLWDDHYLFAKGQLGEFTNLTLFFDSGLILITEIDGVTKQASFSASKESLKAWGFPNKELKRSTFLPTTLTLGVNELKQPETLIWYDQYLKHDRNFGGVVIDGLISHAWLQNYVWTIDFDRMEFFFGL